MLDWIARHLPDPNARPGWLVSIVFVVGMGIGLNAVCLLLSV